MTKYAGRTIFLVRVDNIILLKTFNLEEANEMVFDFNFDIMKGLSKAKLSKAICK